MWRECAPEVGALPLAERAPPALLRGPEGDDEGARRLREEPRELRERRADLAFVEAVETQLDDLRELGCARRGRAQLRRATHADGDTDPYLLGLHHGVCNRNQVSLPASV